MTWSSDESSMAYGQDGQRATTTTSPYNSRAYHDVEDTEQRSQDSGQRRIWKRNGNSRSLEGSVSDGPLRPDRAITQSQQLGAGFDGTDDEPSQHREQYQGTKPTSYRVSGGKGSMTSMVSSEKAERGHSSTSHTGRPDPQLIKDLRAKAVASLQRTREKNSSTPIKEALIEANKAGSGTVIEQSGGQDNSKGSQPTTQVQGQEKDMHQDLDELLAQGKAAAAANHHLNSLKQTEEQSSTNPQGYMKMANESHPSEHGSKKSRQESANKYGNNAHEAKTVLTRHTRETSAPSELGEIVDDSETSKANPSKPEDGVKMKSTPVATSNSHNSYLSKPSSIAMDDRQMVKRNTVELRKQSVDRTPVSEPKRYSREESVHPSGSNVSTRTSQSKHWSEDSYRPMEPRKPSVGTVVRSSNDMRAPSREMYIRRYSDDRQQISHREYSPPRVVEITDHEGHWDEHPRTTTPREYRDSTARRVVVEQPAPPAPARKKMIDLTDSYWTDLEEWLDMTGYHDLSHRQQTLDRQRKLFQIEIEREELTRESQKALEQRAYMARAASIQPRDDVPRGGLAPTSLETRTTRAASVIEMPPPPLPGRDSREDREILRREDRKVDAEVAVLSNPGYPSSSLTYRDEGKSHVQYMESPVTSSDTSGAKRRYHSDEEDVERRPAEKIVRLDSRRTSATVGEDDLILRTPKSYSGSQRDGRRPKDDDGMEDRVNSDLARICGEEAAPRIPKGPAQRGRVATPTGSASRDRARSTSAQPWSRLKEVKITPYKVEENQFGNGQINKKRNDGLYGSSGAPFPERSLPQPTQKPYQVPYWKKNYNNNHTNNHNSNSDNYYNQRGDLFGNRMNEDGKAGKPHQSLLQQRSDHHFQLPLHSHNRGGRGRGRGNSQHHSFRMDRDHNPNERWHHYEPTTPLFDLDHGGVKFFVIKSFNLDNVKAAQREKIWATQQKNEDKLRDAFRNSRHVILLFSINKSMAFQGYARMESAPGTAPTPAWCKELLWKSSGPFFIRWITIAETQFWRVGHLKNSFNENSPVLVGRDGQEVEAGCGIELCRLIDEEVDRFHYGDIGNGGGNRQGDVNTGVDIEMG